MLSSAFSSTSSPSPYQSADDGFQPISDSPVSSPPVSSITVTVRCLDSRSDDWDDAHHDCLPDDKTVVTLPDGTEQTTRCCGEDRPGPGPSVTVTASRQPFVTIHDYIMVVHPWLLAVEPDIRAAIRNHPLATLPATVDVYIHPAAVSPLSLQDSRSTRPAAEEGLWKQIADTATRWAAEEAENAQGQT